MSAFVAHTLREVPSSEAMSQLGADAQSVGQTTWDTMDAIDKQWKLLEGVFTLIPYGSPAEAMGAPVVSASIFADVMAQVRNVLVNASEDVFAKLEQTRAELQGTIQNLNERHYSYSMILDQEIATFQADPANDPVINGRNHPETRAYVNADVNLGLLDEEAERLALDVEMFNRSVDQAEQDLATEIRNLSGGDVINRYDGSTVKTSQTTWGLTPPGSPSGPGAARSAVSLGDYLDLAIARAASDRMNWFTTAGEQEVSDWIGAHPEFFAAIGFIPPAKANEIWDSLRSRSTADASGKWTTGPLATLWDRAPASIGNLNGVKTADRVPWSTRALDLLLDDPTLTDDQRSKLELLQDQALQNGLSVLSVFLDESGAPRASLVKGDPDTAAQIITLTHGIQTDLGTLPEWGKVAADVHWGANRQVNLRDIDSETAVILQMEWDSGWAGSVWGDVLPSEGGARTVALVEGLRHVNPEAWQEGWAHSLGTTAITLAYAQSPGLFDHMMLFGSAGVTPEANDVMEDAIANKDLTVSATGAQADWIAIHGRPHLVSTHYEDPAQSEGVEIIGANGGVIDGYISDDGRRVVGLPVGGHNAGASEDLIYRLHRSPGWDPKNAAFIGPLAPLILMPDDSVGYIDPRSQSFLQAVADFGERVAEHH